MKDWSSCCFHSRRSRSRGIDTDAIVRAALDVIE
jgi:hypothetical protein